MGILKQILGICKTLRPQRYTFVRLALMGDALARIIHAFFEGRGNGLCHYELGLSCPKRRAVSALKAMRRNTDRNRRNLWCPLLLCISEF